MNAMPSCKLRNARTPAASLLAALAAVLLSGCVALTAAPTPPADSSCAALFGALARASEAHRDFQYQPLAGFAGLRSDRLLAELGKHAESAEQRRLWLQRLAAADAEASAIEIAQLSPRERRFWSNQTRQDALAACRAQQVRRQADDPQAFAAALQAAQVRDDYRSWARVIGLNPLIEPLFKRGIAAWQRNAAQNQAPEDGPHWLSYQPLQAQAAPTAITLSEDALGLPQASAEQLQALFARHAPHLRIEQASRSDRVGSPYFGADGRRLFNAQQPRLYRQHGWSRVGDRWQLQLIYQFWFSQRPRPHALDLYGGELDGLIWRVTLDRQGQALLYDSIHPCGCWHSFYLPRQSPLSFHQPANEEARLARRLDFAGHQAATLWLSAGDHQLLWVDKRRSAYPSLRYQQEKLAALRQLPHPEGWRSLYGHQGLVPGSERLERWLLWPSGVISPGAMRQWGRHATAFIGRAHFDDPLLLERYFR